MALVTTMLVLMGVMAIMLLGTLSSGSGGHSGIMSVTGDSVLSAAARDHSVEAFNYAESGMEYARLWLENQSAPPAFV